MNEQTFLNEYSSEYDLLYKDKDYLEEVRRIEKVFKQYSSIEVKSILDLGCGTGTHALILAKHGYEVWGVDRSSAMVLQANLKKAEYPALPITFLESEIVDLKLDRKFDAVLMMFAVLGYHNSNQQILGALRKVKEHLKPGGLFIFDVWYGPAVLAIRPSDRVKVIAISDGELIRYASGSLDINSNLCQVNYQLWRVEGNKVVSRATESHMMRYFFRPELENFMDQADLELVQLSSFEDLDLDSSLNTWNVLGAAQKKSPSD